MRYKICKFRENGARYWLLLGVYIPKFGKFSVKFSVHGVVYRYPCTDGSQIWLGV